MTFRSKLLLLLLSLALPPVVVVSVIDLLTLESLARRLADTFGVMALGTPGVVVLHKLTHERIAYDAVVAMVVVAMAVAAAHVASRRISLPLSLLSRAALRLAAGDTETPVPLRGQDELGRLARAFVQMRSKVKEHVRLAGNLTLARRVQESLVPSAPLRVAGYEVAGMGVPCEDTGGDYYDYLPLSFRRERRGALACIADVAGHGVAAALIMAATRGLLRAQPRRRSLAAEVESLNRQLVAALRDDFFVTMFVLRLGAPGEPLSWCSAGHPPACLWRSASRNCTWLKGQDLILGVDPHWRYRAHRLSPLAAGDIVVMVTDGILEMRNGGGVMFGKEGLGRAVAANAALAPKEVCRAILAAARRYGGCRGRVEDDMTVVVVKAMADDSVTAGVRQAPTPGLRP